MRLIDADEYDRELQIEQMKREEGSWGQRIFEANRIDLANRPTVPAVPLDKLCGWLAKFGCPCALNGGICDQHGIFRCVGYGKSNVFCWRYLLTKMMEEQDK